MSVVGKICVRPLADLIEDHSNKSEYSNFLQQETKKSLLKHEIIDEASPSKKGAKKRAPRKAATTSKKTKVQQNDVTGTVKRSLTTKKFHKKDDQQKKIYTFFKSASKNYNIPPLLDKDKIMSSNKQITKKSRRKIDYDDKSETSISNDSKYQVNSMRKTNIKPVCVIDLLDSDDEENEKFNKIDENKSMSISASSQKGINQSGEKSDTITQNSKENTMVNKLNINIGNDYKHPEELVKNVEEEPTHLRKPKKAKRKILQSCSSDESDTPAPKVNKNVSKNIEIYAEDEEQLNLTVGIEPMGSSTKPKKTNRKILQSSNSEKLDTSEQNKNASLASRNIGIDTKDEEQEQLNRMSASDPTTSSKKLKKTKRTISQKSSAGKPNTSAQKGKKNASPNHQNINTNAEDLEHEKPINHFNKEAAINLKKGKKSRRKDSQKLSFEESVTAISKANGDGLVNPQNIPTKSIDAVIRCKQRNHNRSYSTSVRKLAFENMDESPTTLITENSAFKNRNQFPSPSSEHRFETEPIEPMSSKQQNSPPTASSSKKALISCSDTLTKNGKENCVPGTPPLSTFSHNKEKTEPSCFNLNEKALVASTIESDIIIDTSDDDFEYLKTKKTVPKQSMSTRKTRSRTKTSEPETKKIKKASRPLPPYKIIEGTNGTMAVDAFRYGDIEGVSHYFLTHFHADHYIGLTRKFSHNLYMSSITARLVRAFIPIDEQFIKELDLNKPIMINDVEVTAIDANHCPGAVMLIFKLPDGRCMLHTGDFRASADMESEPIFWNYDIHTIYLDTTYISEKYAFCHQTESIERADRLMKEFIEKNVGTRTLFVCGAYLIGKEKFWSALARKYNFKVFAEGNRKKALDALKDECYNELLTENPCDAQMHVIPLQKINYNCLLEYLEQYAENYDLIFALRPSGWEKNSKPQYRGKVNIIGIEYSEHSSHDEMKRFVQYIRPQNVISTVPVGPNAMITPKVPQKWYKYTTLLQRQYQPSITSFFKMKPDKYLQELTQKHTTMLTQSSIDENAKEQKMAKESLMVISPNSGLNANGQLDQTLKPKQELLAKGPNITETITVDFNTDDDWLT